MVDPALPELLLTTNCLMDTVKEALHDNKIQKTSLHKTILQLQCQMGKEVLKYRYL